jgi:hypothetical protein
VLVDPGLQSVDALLDISVFGCYDLGVDIICGRRVTLPPSFGILPRVGGRPVNRRVVVEQLGELGHGRLSASGCLGRADQPPVGAAGLRSQCEILEPGGAVSIRGTIFNEADSLRFASVRQRDQALGE